MQAIPKPRLLDPNRPLSDARDAITNHEDEPPAELLKEALRDTCAYAQQLWENLDAARSTS
jgi:hypothetical protein